MVALKGVGVDKGNPEAVCGDVRRGNLEPLCDRFCYSRHWAEVPTGAVSPEMYIRAVADVA